MSDGFGFFIEPALRALGVGQVPVVTAVTTFGPDGPGIAFPKGNPDCFVSGTCKRNRVLAHQAAGRAVAFIGDGPSDRSAAGDSDLVFAKHAPEQICLDSGWAFRRWTDFAELGTWLEGTLVASRADPSSCRDPATTAVPRGRGVGPGPLRSGPRACLVPRAPPQIPAPASCRARRPRRRRSRRLPARHADRPQATHRLRHDLRSCPAGTYSFPWRIGGQDRGPS